MFWFDPTFFLNFTYAFKILSTTFFVSPLSKIYMVLISTNTLKRLWLSKLSSTLMMYCSK